MKKNGTISSGGHTCCRSKEDCKKRFWYLEDEPKRFSYTLLEVMQM